MKPNPIFKLPFTFNLKPLTLFNERRKAMKTKLFFAGLLFAVLFFYSLSYSEVPQMINYQGKLTTPGGGFGRYHCINGIQNL
jgi:hypothetical protein